MSVHCMYDILFQMTSCTGSWNCHCDLSIDSYEQPVLQIGPRDVTPWVRGIGPCTAAQNGKRVSWVQQHVGSRGECDAGRAPSTCGKPPRGRPLNGALQVPVLKQHRNLAARSKTENKTGQDDWFMAHSEAYTYITRWSDMSGHQYTWMWIPSLLRQHQRSVHSMVPMDGWVDITHVVYEIQTWITLQSTS